MPKNIHEQDISLLKPRAKPVKHAAEPEPEQVIHINPAIPGLRRQLAE